MQVGNYKIGRYHAILKKYYADGTHDYETDFYSAEDIANSYGAIVHYIGQKIGLATDNPRVLTGVDVIRGKENIIAELGNA